MNVNSRKLNGLALAAILIFGLGTLPAAAQSDDYSPNALRNHRLVLLVRSGRDGLKPLSPAVLHFATESEHCRVTYGSKACGLPSDSLKGSELEQVFDYYVRQPADSAVVQQQPAVRKDAWNWDPRYKPSIQPGNQRR